MIDREHLEAIHAAGGQLVLLKAMSKTPAHSGHMDAWPTVEEATAHQARGGGIGVRPASLDCVVLDCDEGDGPQVAAEWAADALACSTPSSSGLPYKGHVWVRCGEAGSVRNWNFRVDDPLGDRVAGELRTSVHVALTPESAALLAGATEDGSMFDEPHARASRFRDIRPSSADEVDPEFDADEGREVCPEEDGGAWLEGMLEQPTDRSGALFALAGRLKARGVSFWSALEFLEPHTAVWRKGSTGADDGAYAGAGLERHLRLAWRKLPPFSGPGNDFEDDLPPTGEPGAPLDQLVDEMNSKFCAVLDGSQFQVFMEDFDDAFGRSIWTRLTREAFRHYYEDERVPVPDTPSNKFPSKAEVWLASARRRKYRGIVMDPQGLPHNVNKLNLWRGWSIEPRAGDWSLMQELIGEVLCDGDRAAADYVRRWIAYMLQRPWETPEAAIAFRGAEGTGKGTLGRALMRIAGPHGLTVASRHQFAGRFNAHLRNCVFLFADEAIWPGDKDGEGIIKQLVTEPVISYEAKGRDITPGRNMVHLMLASNEDWIVPAGKEARRFLVADVSERRRNDHDFFGRLWEQMEGGGLSAMMHDLISLDLGEWRPSRDIPQTTALGDQKLLSLDPASKFWQEVLSKGNLDQLIFEWGKEIDSWNSHPQTLRSAEKDRLVSAYDSFLKRNRIMSARATHKALAAAGQRFGLEVARPGGQARVWRVPVLREMRARFEESIGAEGVFGA